MHLLVQIDTASLMASLDPLNVVDPLSRSMDPWKSVSAEICIILKQLWVYLPERERETVGQPDRPNEMIV